MKNVIFIFSGNCRTFTDCIESAYTHLISKLFSKDVKIFIYLYLKLSDPGPKGQQGWDYEYKQCDYNVIFRRIQEIETKYPMLNIEYKLLLGDEISNNDLLAQVKDRSLYNGFFAEDKKLLRALHCHYNFEKCGNYILEKETSIQCKFDYIIYVRPDLYFFDSCNNITIKKNKKIIIAGIGIDHIAILPRNHLNAFFFDRMNIYRNNTEKYFTMAEEVWDHTIANIFVEMGSIYKKYYIKRS
jgi:hypothetical protein